MKGVKGYGSSPRGSLDRGPGLRYNASMTFLELDAPPRTRGRAPATVEQLSRRDLTQADLALLASGRGSVPVAISALRERHHHLARVLAQGMEVVDAAAVTGYSISRISILRHDPTFIELMAHYREVENSAFADFTERASQITMTAMDALLDKLEDDPNSIPDTMKLEIAKFGADRTGHAPVQKNVNINANVDLGTRLSLARKRVAAERLTVIGVEAPGGEPSNGE